MNAKAPAPSFRTERALMALVYVSLAIIGIVMTMDPEAPIRFRLLTEF